MTRARTLLRFAVLVILVTTSPQGNAQVRQQAPLPELSVWSKEVAALPMERKAIEAKREEFYALFKDRDVPRELYDRYAAVIQTAFNALRVAEGRAGILRSDSVSFSGLNIDDGNDARRLFLGEFPQVRLKRDSYRFESFLISYLQAHGRKCETRRPPQAAEIKVLRCTATRDIYNGFHTLISSGCASWEWVGSGVFGDPALIAAQEKVSQSMASQTPSQLAYVLANPRALSTLAGETNGAKTAMERLVANNECSSPGMRRFADNLLRFAEGQPPLTIPETPGTKPAAPPAPTLYSACMAERTSKDPKNDSAEYCRCIDRQYSAPVLSPQSRYMYARDYERFVREVLNAQPGSPEFELQLHIPQNVCRAG